MSGICGIVGSAPAAQTEEILAAMSRRMKHRGPDGFTFYKQRQTGAILGHNQLRSFVADARAALPAFAAANGIVVALDGGVTNRAGQFAAGRNPDVQAVLAAYTASGEDGLAQLDGPFSLALWDEAKQRLWLSRDKLGEKTLYYHYDAATSTLIFASEIKALLAHPGVRAELDFDSLALYFAFGYLPGPQTLFKNIFKLLPGESLQFEPGHPPRQKKYWRLPRITDGAEDEAYCIRRLRELFMEGLAAYVNGCQDVAVFLSGGVDSSIIVAGLHELGVSRIHTFTVGFEGETASERIGEDLAYARLVADKFSTRHREVIIGAGHAPGARLLRVVEQFDDLIMTPNVYSKSLLVEAVREAGLNSVLTGSAAAGACGVHRKFLDPKKRAKLLEKTQQCTTDEQRYYTLRSRLFDLETQAQFLKQPPRLGKQDILEVLHHYIGDIKSDDFFRLFLFSNLMITSTEKTLKVLDRVGAMSSVELRSPYLARALVEFSTQLPSSFDGGKTYVSLKTHLKKAFEKILPPPVLERPVIGYPSYYWNNGELQGYQKRLLSREAIAANGVFNYDGVKRLLEEEKNSDAKSVGKQSWALTQFSLWYEIYIKHNPEFVNP
ncbi:MAG: Asparagine synthetase [glutamine-hydrolyzing] 1 [bacterium]|nr:Asparagine synthetase [glutamine-hydrolyzing] 1 [bacterium]